MCVGINEKKVYFRIAEAEDNIPGLLGIDYMTRWRMILDLSKGTFQSHGREKEGIIHASTTSHPCINMFEYPKDTQTEHFAIDDDSEGSLWSEDDSEASQEESREQANRHCG